MLYDLNTIQVDPFNDKIYDVCIVGGGMAGITLALYLKKSFNILLLEGGGLEYSEESQSVYEGTQKGFDTSYSLKNRGGRWLGGSSHLWAGRCHPYVPSDFEKRDYIKYSGWPITKKDLDPYEEETKSILDLPTPDKQKFYKGWTDILEKPDEYFKAIKFLYSRPPTNFKTKYLSTLKNRSNIHCYVNANLTDIKLSHDLSNVEEIEVKNYRQKTFKAQAKVCILATGGIENARLLLNFNKQYKKGIGNENDLVGRFFSDHPHSHVGYFIMEDKSANAFDGEEQPTDMLYAGSVLVPTEKFQKKEQLESLGLHIRPNASVFSRSRKFKDKIKDILCSVEWTKSITDIKCEHYNGSLVILQEQEPNPKSRVTLESNTDIFGHKRAVLDWQFVEKDMLSCKNVLIPFSKKFTGSDLGRIKIDDWLLKKEIKYDTQHTSGGYHLMGTTRMATSEKEGVVDSNLKIFGINNLYIAGSSVFPTGGSMNPTFAIIQTTLRLAKYLNKTV